MQFQFILVEDGQLSDTAGDQMQPIDSYMCV